MYMCGVSEKGKEKKEKERDAVQGVHWIDHSPMQQMANVMPKGLIASQ